MNLSRSSTIVAGQRVIRFPHRSAADCFLPQLVQWSAVQDACNRTENAGLKMQGNRGAAMDFAERKLYHQIHPVKLGTDISVTLPFLYFLWEHHPIIAAIVGFVPPILVSAVMLTFPPDLERQKNSRLGRYISRYMTPTIEVIRLLTLVPMAYGAWVHEPWWIVLGVVVLVGAWCNGLLPRLTRVRDVRAE
jgi:hypothetical protein